MYIVSNIITCLASTKYHCPQCFTKLEQTKIQQEFATLSTTEIDLLSNEAILILFVSCKRHPSAHYNLCSLAQHEHPLTTHPLDTMLCKPTVISNYQQILKSEIYKSKLTIRSVHKPFFYNHETLLMRFGSFTWQIPAFVMDLPTLPCPKQST